MGRPLRIEFPGAIYHITSRGNAQQPIYISDKDREDFLKLLGDVVTRHRWLCHAYCLMNNHYHLLVETPVGGLSAGMRQLNGMYTQHFNFLHRRVGHVLQGRFKAILIERESYLLELSRYIVLNPVRANIVSDPAAWNWSSYRATAGQGMRPPWLSTDWILSQFATNRSEAHEEYCDFVRDGYTKESPWKDLQGGIYLGSQTFCERFQRAELLEEVPREQQRPVRPLLETVFVSAGTRSQQVLKAHREYGYSLKEIAKHIGVHYTTVSRWLHAAEQDEQMSLSLGKM
jgi:putative transposase